MRITLNQAERKLKIARLERKSLNLTIKRLRILVANLGGKPLKLDLSDRNKRIYQDWKNGENTRNLSFKYNISTDRIRTICQREKFRENKTG